MRLILPLLMVLSQPADACAVAEPFAVADIALGPVVVVAEVTDYRIGNQGGRLTLDVAEVWKGSAPGHLTARWTVRMAEIPPETWDGRRTRLSPPSHLTGRGST